MSGLKGGYSRWTINRRIKRERNKVRALDEKYASCWVREDSIERTTLAQPAEVSNEPTASGSAVAPGAVSTTSHTGLSAVEASTPSVSQSPVIPNISGAIRLFAIYSRSVTSTDLKLLLTLLKPFVPDLPLDPRTIRRTPRNVHKTVLTSGCYVHIGMPTCMRSVYHRHRFNNGDHLTMQVNIDGVPLFDYPGTELWPILGRIVHPFISTPFVIGSYCGRGRPDPVNEYLQPFVSEMIAIRNAGVTLNDLHLTIHVHIQCVICDAPARSYVKQTKSHNGYHGCDRCVQRGAYCSSRRMTFPSTSSKIRTNSSFRERHQPDHHIGTTVLLQLPLDMVADFPLDPMHLVFLGVMKRLVHIWCLSEKRSGLRLSSSMQRAAETKLEASVSHLPIDFPRKCGMFTHFERFKANECRVFLLYLGPVVMRPFLPHPMYENFLNLFLSIYILSHPSWCHSLIDRARFLLLKFVDQFAYLYGGDQLVYNVHCLTHLCDDVQRFGPLHRYWAFYFESFMSSVLRLVKGTKEPATQVHNRVCEYSMLTHVECTGAPMDDTNLCNPMKCNRHMFMVRCKFYISCVPPDNCVMINNKPYCVHQRQEDVIFCKPFVRVRDFCSHAFPSSDLCIFRASGISTTLKIKSLSSIVCKCVLIPDDDEFVIIPLLHTFQ